jgi:hypothetical protein
MARKGLVNDWKTPEGLLMLQGWARDGLSDFQIAKNIGIHVATLYDWKNKYVEIDEAIKKGKAPVDYEIENALYKAAKGYTVTLRKPVKVRIEKQKQGEGKIVEEHIEYTDEEVHIPPNVTAQIYWLKNRRTKHWRDRPEVIDTTALEKLDEILKGIEKDANDNSEQ